MAKTKYDHVRAILSHSLGVSPDVAAKIIDDVIKEKAYASVDLSNAEERVDKVVRTETGRTSAQGIQDVRQVIHFATDLMRHFETFGVFGDLNYKEVINDIAAFLEVKIKSQLESLEDDIKLLREYLKD